MKTLVIGGNGFIGSHLVDKLVEIGWDVTVFDIQGRRFDKLPAHVHFIHGDMNQLYLIREALLDVDVVIHLAWATIHEISIKDPSTDVIANLVPTINLLDECQRASVKRIVFISSGGTIYGPTNELPIPETHPLNPIAGYGITKLAVEKYLYMFNALYNLDYAILRPSVPYGPRQNPHGRQGAVNVFLYRIINRFPISIWGDGNTTRDYFYISDLVDAIILSATKNLSEHRIFNLGGGKGISLSNLILQIEEVTGIKAEINYHPARIFDIPQVVLDTRLAKNVLNWNPQVSLKDGLVITMEWMAVI